MQIWKYFSDQMRSLSGQTEQISQTWAGMVSTLQGQGEQFRQLPDKGLFE